MMKDGICSFTYPHGSMMIVMDKFFPTTKANIRLLVSTIGETLDWSYPREQVSQDILEWMEDERAALAGDICRYGDSSLMALEEADEAVDQAKQQEAKVEQMKALKLEGMPAGRKKACREELKAEKEKLKAMKKRARELYAKSRQDRELCKKAIARSEGLKGNMEQIRQLTAGWL